MTQLGPQTAPNAAPAVAANLASAHQRIAAAARAAGCEPAEVTLIAISKTHSAALIRAALEAGHRVFGENRVQEAERKWPALKAEYPGAELHLVGPLQTNKVQAAVALFDVIATVDREKLAAALAAEMERADRRPRCLIEINTGEEAQKHGVVPAEADGFIAHCREVLGLPVEGLMCIPPQDEEPALHFALLGQIARRNGLGTLSMGMTEDFEVAVAFGATQVRIGTAIFGPRGR
jgi:pyridoxal phosphate enzyme (YggS family)